MAVVRGEERAPAGRLGAAEVAVLGVAALALAVLWGAQLVIVPHFAAMFADFGGELPAITRAAIGHVLAVGASVLTVALAALGTGLRLWRRGALGWSALGLAAALPLVSLALLLVAMYAPIFALAGAIR